MNVAGIRDLRLKLERIENAVNEMPQAYGDGFRYILHQDIDARLQKYLELAERSRQPAVTNDCIIARHA